VQTGISDQERIEIRSGVGPEDEIIVGPFRTLDEMSDGQPVKPEEPKPADAGAKPSATTRNGESL
jgi:hypothetical protein